MARKLLRDETGCRPYMENRPNRSYRQLQPNFPYPGNIQSSHTVMDVKEMCMVSLSTTLDFNTVNSFPVLYSGYPHYFKILTRLTINFPGKCTCLWLFTSKARLARA